MVKAVSTVICTGLVFLMLVMKIDESFFFSKAEFAIEYLILLSIVSISVCAYPVFKKEKKALLGMMFIGIENIYHMIEQMTPFERIVDAIPSPIALFLDDGCILIGIGLLALSVKQIITKYESSQSIDELTGVFNRKALGNISLKKFDLIFFDLDNFKKLNDEHGHKFGDSVLVLFSQGLKQHTQRNEMVIRFGGDEFIAILLPYRAKSFLTEIKTTLSALNISYSYGIAPNSDRRNLREAINCSDEELYRMKHLKHPPT
ncbi:GGDEF domain-containing protein [Photobacterium rosenbergii]|uniref:GGDEF domain-containing protein n=1 Tax=Photobacterium rosenbergii TaxID=294936 RepID=UPI001C99E680|nr:GGDEF domain-containing protein [Photobacterium rosenbergii]MBY5945073.1 GGDEF domain-containing protein [Photobacterium rosenbergii]